jgi:hypothetical protein
VSKRARPGVFAKTSRYLEVLASLCLRLSLCKKFVIDHIMSFHFISFHFITLRAILFHDISCHIMSLSVVLCHIMPYHALLDFSDQLTIKSGGRAEVGGSNISS